jgi:hypothetical protein
MEQEGVEAALVYGSGRYASDIFWLSDWPCSREAYVLMQTGKKPVILMQLFNHYPMARVMSWIEDVRWAGANTTSSVVELLRERGLDGKKIGLVGAIPYQVYNKLREVYPNAVFVDLGGKLRMMRTIKRAGVSEGRRLCRYSLHEQHADARPGLRGAVAVSFQQKIAQGRRPDHRDQRRLRRLQRPNSPHLFPGRRADGAMAEDA